VSRILNIHMRSEAQHEPWASVYLSYPGRSIKMTFGGLINPRATTPFSTVGALSPADLVTCRSVSRVCKIQSP
jgi:hypothetical protein